MGTRLLHIVITTPLEIRNKSKFQRAKKWRFERDPKYDASAEELLSDIGASNEWPHYKIFAFDALNKGK